MIQSPPRSPQMNTEIRLPKKHKVAIIFTASSCFFVSSTLLVLYIANAAAVLPLNVAAFLSLYSPIVICALIVTISAVASATAISSYKSNEKHQAESVKENNNTKSPTPSTTPSTSPEPPSEPVGTSPPPPPPPPPGGLFSKSRPAQNGAGATTGGVQNASSETYTKKPAKEDVCHKMLADVKRGVILRSLSLNNEEISSFLKIIISELNNLSNDKVSEEKINKIIKNKVEPIVNYANSLIRRKEDLPHVLKTAIETLKKENIVKKDGGYYHIIDRDKKSVVEKKTQDIFQMLRQQLEKRREGMCPDDTNGLESDGNSGWSSDEEDNYCLQPFKKSFGQKSPENGAAASQSKSYYESSSRDSGLFSEEDSDSWQSPINQEDSPSQKFFQNGGTASDQKSPDKSVISSSKTAPVGSTDVKNYQQPSTEKPNSSNNGVNTSTKKETPPAVLTGINSPFSVRKMVEMFGG